MIHKDAASLIGNTPIVKLNKVAAHVKSEIFVKLEYLNPGGSMKDRVALHRRVLVPLQAPEWAVEVDIGCVEKRDCHDE